MADMSPIKRENGSVGFSCLRQVNKKETNVEKCVKERQGKIDSLGNKHDTDMATMVSRRQLTTSSVGNNYKRPLQLHRLRYRLNNGATLRICLID